MIWQGWEPIEFSLVRMEQNESCVNIFQSNIPTVLFQFPVAQLYNVRVLLSREEKGLNHDQDPVTLDSILVLEYHTIQILMW